MHFSASFAVFIIICLLKYLSLCQISENTFSINSIDLYILLNYNTQQPHCCWVFCIKSDNKPCTLYLFVRLFMRSTCYIYK